MSSPSLSPASATQLSVNDYAGVLGAGAPSQTSGASKWKGIMSANYKTGPYSVTAQVRWYGQRHSQQRLEHRQSGDRGDAAGRSRTACSMSIRPPIWICARSYDLTDNWQFYRRHGQHPGHPAADDAGLLRTASSRTAVPPTRSRNTTCWAAKSASASASTSKGASVPAMRTAGSV